MKFSRSSLPLALAVAMASAACDAGQDISTPGDTPQASRAPAPAGDRWDPDNEFARASREEAQGFAGFYLQNDGTPVILLANGRGRGEAQRYLAGLLAESRKGRHARAPQTPVFRTVSYDFAQLKGWFDQLDDLLERDEVYLMDVDEVNNRVLVGVRDGTAVREIRSEALGRGIPAAALHVEVRKPTGNRQAQTLRDYAFTVMGGFQHQFSPDPYDICTIGFTAIWNNRYALVTNSHCTVNYLASDGTAMMQPVWAAGNQIGFEVKDRGTYGCNGWFTSCRRSDAAIYERTIDRSPGIVNGFIAKTAFAYGGPGSLDITGSYSIIRRYAGSSPVGTWLDKTGRTTGSTYGQVTQSCVAIGKFRCQDISNIYSEPGDSGSPVYVWLGNDEVELYGLMWGGPDGDWNTTYSSRLAGVEADLGSLSGVCRSGYGC
jgi:hypothetical protein